MIRLIEYWEDPDVLFDWTRDALEHYADGRRWVLLFNALVLSAASDPRAGAGPFRRA